jgi:hypothetical protein
MRDEYVVMTKKESSLLNLIPKGDALPVVNEINSDYPYLSKIGHCTDGIKSTLNSFRHYNVFHVKNETNSVTHALAKAVMFNKALLAKQG